MYSSKMTPIVSMVPFLVTMIVTGLRLVAPQPTVDPESTPTGCDPDVNIAEMLKNLLAGQEDMKAEIHGQSDEDLSSIRNSSAPINGILMQQHFPSRDAFFNRSWAEFKVEFGSASGNYWIGNERLHQLTKSGRFKLRVDIQAAFNEHWYWAEYGTFKVGAEFTRYRLEIGGYSGNAGDGMTVDGDWFHTLDGRRFTTYDFDYDHMTHSNCAYDPEHDRLGGFWYSYCATGFALVNQPRTNITAYNYGKTTFSWMSLPFGLMLPYYKTLSYSRMTLVEK